MFVRDYMTPNPIVVDPDISFPEATSLMRKRKIRRLPVVENGRLVGIIVEKDLLSNQPSPATLLSIHEMYALLERLRVRQMMSRPVITVEGDCPVEEAARIMVEHKIGCLPIMQADNLVGIITETDVFKVLVEVLGGQESGLRLTLSLTERVGELSKLTAQIAQAGGNISAVTSSRILGDSRREVMIKITGVEESTLRTIMQDSDISVLDLRTTSRYQTNRFG